MSQTSPYSPAIQTLTDRESYIRSMLGDYEKSSMQGNKRTTRREIASINPSKGGIYSSTVAANQLRARAGESGMRSGGYLENMISRTRASSQADQTGDLASQHSHEEDRKQGYAFAQAQGNAAANAQKRAQTMQLVGMLGGAALAAFL